jgi:hypothetical protein
MCEWMWYVLIEIKGGSAFRNLLFFRIVNLKEKCLISAIFGIAVCNLDCLQKRNEGEKENYNNKSNAIDNAESCSDITKGNGSYPFGLIKTRIGDIACGAQARKPVNAMLLDMSSTFFTVGHE